MTARLDRCQRTSRPERLAAGRDQIGKVGDIVSESTGDFISVRLGDFVGIRNQIIEISFLMERQPDPKTDGDMLDWIGDLRKDQRFYRDRVSLMERCMKTLNEYIAAVRPQVN
ncbi:hypothetical protein ACVIJ6_001068 [Bradyrhizobium sp. USDA 4369]